MGTRFNSALQNLWNFDSALTNRARGRDLDAKMQDVEASKKEIGAAIKRLGKMFKYAVDSGESIEALLADPKSYLSEAFADVKTAYNKYLRNVLKAQDVIKRIYEGNSLCSRRPAPEDRSGERCDAGIVQACATQKSRRPS